LNHTNCCRTNICFWTKTLSFLQLRHCRLSDPRHFPVLTFPGWPIERFHFLGTVMAFVAAISWSCSQSRFKVVLWCAMWVCVRNHIQITDLYGKSDAKYGIFYGGAAVSFKLRSTLSNPCIVLFTTKTLSFVWAKTLPISEFGVHKHTGGTLQPAMGEPVGCNTGTHCAYPCLSLDDGVCRMTEISGFPWKIHILLHRWTPRAIYPSRHHI